MTEEEKNGFNKELRKVWLIFGSVMVMLVLMSVFELFMNHYASDSYDPGDTINTILLLVGAFFGGGAAYKYRGLKEEKA